MAIVDLRGRADDPDVRELTRLASPDAADRLEQAPLLIPLREGEELVGGVGIERTDDREIRLRTLYAREEFRLRGIGRRLVEAVVSGAPVEQFVATRDAATAGFFERCGFTVTDGVCVRIVPTVPAPAVEDALMLGNARERHALLAGRVRAALAGPYSA